MLESVLFLVSNLFLYAWLDESSMSRSLIQLIFFIGRLVCLIGNYLKYCTWFLASFCLLSIILTWTWLNQVILRTLGFHRWPFIDRVILRLIWNRGHTAFTKCTFIHHEILQLLGRWLSNILRLSFLLWNLCSIICLTCGGSDWMCNHTQIEIRRYFKSCLSLVKIICCWRCCDRNQGRFLL